MPSAKTKGAPFRISPAIKATLRQVAERERRCLTNVREVMIRGWSADHQTMGGAKPATDRPKGLGEERAG